MTWERDLVGLANLYGRSIDAALIEVWRQDMRGIDPAAISGALIAYRRNPQNRSFPLPAQIRAIIEPADPTADDVAKEISARVIGAVSRFGWCNADDARAYIGEIGWRNVHKMGGWAFLCESLGRSIQVTSFQAQFRELVRKDAEFAKAGGEFPQAALDVSPHGKMAEALQIAKRNSGD